MTSLHTNPHFFPFEKVDKDKLVPAEKYYIKLKDSVINDYLGKNRNVPVSSLKGTFVRLHTNKQLLSTIEYAVFKNVVIMNREYKEGLCLLMLVKNGTNLSSTACSTYSDEKRGRIINEDREVYFPVNRWMFGKMTEQSLLAKQVLRSPYLDVDNQLNITDFMKNKGGKKRKTKKRTRNNSKRKRRNKTKYRRRRSRK